MDGARKQVLAICCAIGGAVSSAMGAAFTPGDIVVFEGGNGTINLNLGTANACSLLEFSPTAVNQSAPIQTIPLPSVDSGTQHALTTSGQYNDHLMTLSSDGRYLSVMGYDLAAGSNYIDSTGNSQPAYATPNRTIARIDAGGNVDTSTAGPFGAGNTYTRGTASMDGSGFWYTTTPVNSGSPSVGYVPFGSSTPTVLSANYSGRGIDVYGGQLYSSSIAVSTAGMSTIGIGVPISGSPSINGMSNTGTPLYNIGTTGFFMATLKPGDTQPDVLYVCNYYTFGEIDKFSLINGTWTWNGNMPITLANDMTGTVSNGVVTLYATSLNSGSATLSSITDIAGYNTRPSSTSFTTLASISTNGNTIGFRGLAVAPTAEITGSPTWNSNSGGNWSSATNWTGGVPNSVGASATFGAQGTAPQTVFVDSAQTIGTLNFSSPFSYTIAGSAPLTLSNLSGPASISVTAGSHTIGVPLVVTSGLSIFTALGTGLTLPLTTNTVGALTKSGAGALSFSNSTAGITKLTIASLALSGGGLRLENGTAGNRTLLILGGFSLAGGPLDVGSNDVDFQNASLFTVQTDLKIASITSSTAASDSTHLTALGVIQNTVDGSTNGTPLYGSGAGTLGLFDGFSPAAGDVLMKFTYYGDANLDGKIDGSDYSRIDSGALSQSAGWYNGDFNYDGVVDGSDFTLVDNAFNNQGVAYTDLSASLTDLVAISTSVVPEPVAGIGLLMSITSLGRLRLRRTNRTF